MVEWCHWIESDGVDAMLPTVTDDDFDDLWRDHGDQRVKILIDAYKALRTKAKELDSQLFEYEETFGSLNGA